MSSNRACRVESLDLEAIKSPSSTSWMSNSSSPSPSSTISDSSNCTLKRKPRTPRKRPNQTYNEAAAILSTAYPKIFPVNTLTKAHNINNTFLFEPSELLMPCQQLESSLDSRMTWMEKADFSIHVKGLMNSESPEMDSSEFDTGSILDEELGKGIESIMGNMEIENQQIEITKPIEFCYGYPVGRGFQVEYGMRRESRAMRDVDRCDWWSFPTVNLIEVAPFESMKIKNSESVPQLNAGLLLKLNYDDVLHAWSDKDSPFAGDSPANESAGNDVRARAAQIDLFSDNGGVREASVLRYKEKRRTRLFSKKIRYQVRKLNADRRPRMKGRFVRTPED